MQQKREPSRLMPWCIWCSTGMNRSSLLHVTSVIAVAIFSVVTLFSCHQVKMIKPTESDTDISEKNGVEFISTSGDDWLLRPIPGNIVAFRHIPLAVAVQIIRPAALSDHLQAETSSRKGVGVATVTTSEGRRVRGVVRELVTVAGGIQTGQASQRQGFPWTESDLVMYENHDGHPSSVGERHQSFLVINDGSELVSGLARIGDTTIGVEVEDLPDITAVDFGSDDEPKTINRYGHPDPVSPLDAFRRSLFNGWSSAAPAINVPAKNDIHALVESLPDILSKQNAANFYLGLNRLRAVSPSAADTLVEVLTRRCRDGSTTFASWVAHPADLANLDYLLSSKANAGRAADWASSILAWVDDQPGIIGWVESGQGTNIRLALANLNGVSEEREIAFVSREGAGNPQLLKIPARTVYRTQLTRSAADSTDSPDGFIEIRNRGRVEQRLSLRPSMFKAVPPFALLAPTVEMWQVDSWIRRDMGKAAPGRQTAARLSFRDGRWRLRFDCQVPIRSIGSVDNGASGKDGEDVGEASAPSAPAIPANIFNTDNQQQNKRVITNFDDLSGLEAITLFIGSYNKPHCVISIMPDGGLFIWEADREVNEKTLRNDFALHIMHHEHAWSVALNLPDWWLDDDESTIEVGYIRTHEGWRAGDCYPYACLPWRLNPGRVFVDLSSWNP